MTCAIAIELAWPQTLGQVEGVAYQSQAICYHTVVEWRNEGVGCRYADSVVELHDGRNHGKVEADEEEDTPWLVLALVEPLLEWQITS